MIASHVLDFAALDSLIAQHCQEHLLSTYKKLKDFSGFTSPLRESSVTAAISLKLIVHGAKFHFFKYSPTSECTEFREDRFVTHEFSFSFVCKQFCFLFPKCHSLAHLQDF